MDHLRNLTKIRDAADLKDVAVSVAGKMAGQLGERVAKEKMNQLVDKLTTRLSKAVTEAGLDPIVTPETEASFTANVACLPLPGTARLHDGGVRGLASLRRRDDISVRVEGNSRVFVDAALAIGPVTASVTGDARFACCLSATPVFTVTCSELVLRLSFNGDLNERRLTVTEFRLDELPTLTAEVSGVDGEAEWIRQLADKVLEMERERLVEAAKNKVAGMAKGFIEDPRSLADLM